MGKWTYAYSIPAKQSCMVADLFGYFHHDDKDVHRDVTNIPPLWTIGIVLRFIIIARIINTNLCIYNL